MRLENPNGSTLNIGGLVRQLPVGPRKRLTPGRRPSLCCGCCFRWKFIDCSHALPGSSRPMACLCFSSQPGCCARVRSAGRGTSRFMRSHLSCPVVLLISLFWLDQAQAWLILHRSFITIIIHDASINHYIYCTVCIYIYISLFIHIH